MSHRKMPCHISKGLFLATPLLSQLISVTRLVTKGMTVKGFHCMCITELEMVLQEAAQYRVLGI